MNTIRELFSKRIDRRIEEVIKVDQADEETVLDELQEYVLTDSIGEHFTTVYKAIADAPSEPHEGIGIWVSGFFGSGKSSFAKIMGYTVAGRLVCGQSASEILKDKAQRELPPSQANTVAAYLDVITTNIRPRLLSSMSPWIGGSARRTSASRKSCIKPCYAPSITRRISTWRHWKSVWKPTGSSTDFAIGFRRYTATAGRSGANSGGPLTKPVPYLTSSIHRPIRVPIRGPNRWARGAPTSRRTCWRNVPSN